MVDRGFIPLVGIMLIFLGLWAESGASDAGGRNASALKLFSLIVASILGLCFLLIVPWHVITTRDASDTQVKQVADEASKARTQLDAQVDQLKGQGSQQLDAQLAVLDQAIKEGTLPPDQLAQAQQQRDKLKKLKADPKALQAEVNAQIAPKLNEEKSKIDSREQELKDQTQGTAMRAALRTGLNSLLLAIAYSIVGWTGLRHFLSNR
jgi:small-conductance mechanosensitive channel